jgi:hypothetical protein
MPDDLREELVREISSDKERESLRVAQEEFSQREDRAAADRRALLPQTRAAHKAFVEGLMS